MKKLVLFDIDGTLMYHVGVTHWNAQYQYGMQQAYGIKEPYDFSVFNGSIERHMAWEIAKKHHIARDHFLQKFSAYVSAMQEHLVVESKKGPLFNVIPEAMKLVQDLSVRDDVILGILTGNAQSIAQWKLVHTGYDGYFRFGLYGEEADDRISLAKLVFAKATKQFGITLQGKEIVVIGDTIHDIRCGKAIGARTIAVTTGMHNDPSVLAAENPDLLVDTLADPRVMGVLLTI